MVTLAFFTQYDGRNKMFLRQFSVVAAVSSLLALSSLGVAPMTYAESFRAGISISDESVPEATGLRVYPGAKRVEKSEGSDANLQLSFGEYGIKIVAATLRSADLPERIAAFYRDDLARYGEVLDCTESRETREVKSRREKSDRLSCKGETAPKNGMLFRAGTKGNERVVSISPKGDGTELTLVYVRAILPK
jgi:hypothetical protein